jgi:hypothetical protein
MFRIVLLFCLLAATLHAETIEATGTITRVTLYPSGASVVRAIEFDAPAGVHDLIIPGLPAKPPHRRCASSGRTESPSVRSVWRPVAFRPSVTRPLRKSKLLRMR